jgi:hypothetical protein
MKVGVEKTNFFSGFPRIDNVQCFVGSETGNLVAYGVKPYQQKFSPQFTLKIAL